MGEGIFASDGTRNRVQIGDLQGYQDPNGVSSPAEWGVRVLDGSGDIVFDTLGIVAVAKVIATGTSGQSAFTCNGDSNWQLNLTSPSFTLDRAGHLLIFSTLAAVPQFNGGHWCYGMTEFPGGTGIFGTDRDVNWAEFGSPTALSGGSYGGASVQNVVDVVDYPSPGTYSVSLYVAGDSGMTLVVNYGQLVVLQLGN